MCRYVRTYVRMSYKLDRHRRETQREVDGEETHRHTQIQQRVRHRSTAETHTHTEIHRERKALFFQKIEFSSRPHNMYIPYMVYHIIYIYIYQFKYTNI